MLNSLGDIKYLELRHLKESKILIIKINNLEFKNALTDQVIDELVTVLKSIDENNLIRVALLGGTGNIFCAGGDIKAMASKSGMFAGNSIQLRENYRKGIQKIPKVIEGLSKPLIGVINGTAIGAGVDLACMCDFRVGSEKSVFAETFSKLALVPGDGGTYFLPRVVGYPKAMEMFLTGDKYNADEALQMGLLNYLYPNDKLWQEAIKIAEKIAGNSPVAISMTKKALRSSWINKDLGSHLDLLASFQGITQKSLDHEEGLKALKEKRQPNFEGI